MTAPSPICDAYSGGCVTPGPTTFPSTAPPVAPPALPVTGLQVGDLILAALVLLCLGVAALMVARIRKMDRQ